MISIRPVDWRLAASPEAFSGKVCNGSPQKMPQCKESGVRIVL
jgi:hypothetical protein